MMDTEQKGTCRLGMVVKSVMYSCAAVITESSNASFVHFRSPMQLDWKHHHLPPGWKHLNAATLCM